MANIEFKFRDKSIKNGDRTKLCAILNVTPDSFSDGGKYFDVEMAVKRAKELVRGGADILDIGGESTRPGSKLISVEEEIERIVPVIKAIKSEMDVIISVDTWKSEVAKAVIYAGADIINDITGLLGDEKMVDVITNSNVGYVMMFNPVIIRPEHDGSKIFPKFGKNAFMTDKDLEYLQSLNILDMMEESFNKTLKIALEKGVEKERICLDPGIGFALTKRENLELIKGIDRIHDMGYLSFLGVSRKRFVVNILAENNIESDIKTEEGLFNVDLASAYLSDIASFKGVNILRVHDFNKHFSAMLIGDSIRMADKSEDINFGAYKK